MVYDWVVTGRISGGGQFRRELMERLKSGPQLAFTKQQEVGSRYVRLNGFRDTSK
jgi:hypothetical protein